MLFLTVLCSAMSLLKTCTKCGVEKSTEDFYRHGSGTRNGVCKTCADNIRRQQATSSYRLYLKRLLTQTKSKRRKTDISVEITLDQLCELWEQQSGKCAISNVHMTHHRDGTGRKDFNVSLDRIEPPLGYVNGNVQLVCDRVNIMRHTLTMDMFYWWVKTISAHSCD